MNYIPADKLLTSFKEFHACRHVETPPIGHISDAEHYVYWEQRKKDWEVHISTKQNEWLRNYQRLPVRYDSLEV
jgi:hypothetical protein